MSSSARAWTAREFKLPGCRLAPRLWAMDGAEVRFATIVSTLGVRQFETVMVMPELVPLTLLPYEATLCRM